MDEFQENKNLPEKAIANLSRTALWAKIVCGFLSIVCIFNIISTINTVLNYIYSWTSLIPGIIKIIIYTIMVIILWNKSEKYKKFCNQGDLETLESAFEVQKKYWQLCGWIAIAIGLMFIINFIVKF